MNKYSTNEISEIKIIKMNIINMRIQFGMKQSRERERFFLLSIVMILKCNLRVEGIKKI